MDDVDDSITHDIPGAGAAPLVDSLTELPAFDEPDAIDEGAE